MKYLILTIIAFSTLTPISEAEEIMCAPETFEREIVQSLANELAKYKVVKANDNTPEYNAFIAYVTVRELRNRYVPKFPTVHKDLMRSYLATLKELDQVTYIAQLSEDDSLNDLSALRDRHFYITRELLPLAIDRAYFGEYILTENPLAEYKSLTEDLLIKLNKELNISHLENCVDQEAEASQNLKKIETNTSLNDLPLPSVYDDFQLTGKVTDLTQPDSFTKVKPHWINRIFSGFMSLFFDKDSEITSASNPTNLSYVEDKNFYRIIADEHAFWKGEQDYWLTQSKTLSGAKVDSFNKRFVALDNIFSSIDKQLDLVLGAISHVCQNQDAETNCWPGSNNAPQL